MSYFSYRGRNAAGDLVQGVLEAGQRRVEDGAGSLRIRSGEAQSLIVGVDHEEAARRGAQQGLADGLEANKLVAAGHVPNLHESRVPAGDQACPFGRKRQAVEVEGINLDRPQRSLFCQSPQPHPVDQPPPDGPAIGDVLREEAWRPFEAKRAVVT